ncbi:MAG: DUF4058 family protein [Caldilineaceae bacterium]
MATGMDNLSSPFLGMDPFLEEPALWGSVHTRLMNSLSDQLADRIAPDFYVDIQQHVTIMTPGDEAARFFIPDVYVAEQRNPAQHTVAHSSPSAVITQPTIVEPLEQLELYERHLEIRDRRTRDVITIIEVLSPWNKSAGRDRWDAFQEKRRKVIASPTHWVEIDLLRAGRRPPEITGKSDYYALLKRGGALGPYEVWYIDLRDRLPTIAIPLRESYADAPLDLQSALDDAYRRAHYAQSIDYTDDVPSPNLSPADLQWVRAQIANWAS